MAQTAPQFDWESARPVDEEPQQPAAAPATADDTYPGAPLAEKQTAAPLSPALFDWESARPVEAAQDFDMESAAPLKELAEDPSYLMSREQFRAHRRDAKETESAVADFLGGLPGVVPGLYSITTGTIGELGQQVAQNWYRPDKLLASLTANQNEGVRRMALSYAKMVDYVGQNLRDMDINRKREAAYGEQLRQKMQQEGKLTGDPIKDHEAVMQALFAAKDAGEIPLTDEQVAEDEERAYQDYWRGKNFDQAIGNITNIKIAGMDATTPSMEWGARNIVTGEYVAPGKFSPDAVGMGIDPANILAAGIGSLARVNALRRAGILLGKGLGPTGEVLSKTGAAIGRGADAVTQRIQLATGGQRVGEKVIGGLSPEMQAYGGVTSAAAVGYMTGGDTPLDQAMTGALALLPTVRMVGGTLRKAGTAANAGWIITREMDAGAMSAARADAAKGLAANSAIPERYAKFIRGEGRASADSTLRRVAQDQANPRLLRSLSQFGDNVGLTSAVRATDDAIGGALVGASATVPFALAAPEPEQAGGIIGMGLMLGGAGGVVGGKLTRVAEMQDAMVARMLVDAQASGGNADAFSRLPHQDLVSLAGLQAFSRGKLTFKPLTTSEYRVNLDVTKRRGENSAGFYVETADDGTSTVFINMGEPSAVAGVVSKIRPVTKGGKTIEVRDKDGNSTFTYVPNESRIAVKQGDSVGVGSPLTRGTPSRLSVPEEIAHAIFSSKAMDGLPRDEMRNYINQRYKTEGVAARGREYAARIVDQDIAAGVYGAADSIDDAARDRLVEQRFTEFSQASIEDGADPLDWARDEIIAASLRASVQGIDLARLRNQSNFSRLAEQVVASSAQALRVLGVDVDKMGRVLDPAGTFRDNPVFADPAMRRMVTKYMRDYDQWLAGMEDAGRKDRRGVRVAPSGKVEDYANSQHTVLREIKDANGNGTGVFENDVVTRGADGVVRPKKQSDIDRTEVSRAAQIKSLWDAGKTVPTASAEFGKRRVNGRDIVGGPTLPKQWDLFTQFPQWIREFARQLEAGRGDGRTWIADYNAIGTGSSGRYRVTNLGNIEAILREVAFVGWQVTKKNHLLATVFDMNAFRAAAKRAIDNGELGEMGNNMDEVNATLLQYLDNHKNGRPGEYGIGQTKKNILNGLIGTGTAKQTAANPFYAELNPRGSVRTFRVDRLNDLRDTGRTGYNFMYEPINANMMPDAVRAPKDLSTDQILRELEENQGYLGLSTLGMREGRPVKGGAQQTRELLKRNTALNEELRRRGGPQEESDVARVLRQRGQAMPDTGAQSTNDAISPAMSNYRGTHQAGFGERGDIQTLVSHSVPMQMPGEYALAIVDGLHDEFAFRHGQGFVAVISDTSHRFWSRISSHMFRLFQKEIGKEVLPPNTFIRVTNQKEDYTHIKKGTHRGSRNHGLNHFDNTDPSEGGLSVAYDFEHGAKYAYLVTGEIATLGTDGEPVLALKSVKPASQLMPYEKLVNKLNIPPVPRRESARFYFSNSKKSIPHQFGGVKERPDLKPIPIATEVARGRAMPDVTITPDEARRRGLVGPVYHGSPDFKGRKFDPKYRARSSGLSRGGFSFSDDVASADSYAAAPIDSAQAAVDSANDVMREAAGRMERGLKIKGFSAADELPEFNVRYVDDISELSSYFNELAKDMPKDLATRLRDAAKQVNEPANPVVVEAYLRNPKTMDIDGKKLWLVDNPDDIFVSAARPPQGAATGRTRGQAMPDVADAPPFYLKSSKALDAKVQGKAATPDQIKAILTNPQNGIKAEELKWTGVMQEVERLAKKNNGKVPKEALLRYLAEDGAVRLEEVRMGETTMPVSQIRQMVDAGERIDVFDSQFGRAISYDDLGAYGPDERLTVRLARTTKYGQYQLPGGENYREVVLAMSNPISGKSKQITDKYGIPYETSSAYLLQQAGATLEEIRQYQSGIEGASFVPTDYRSTHFDTPNYVAHMRLNERVDAKGKPGLFIEELQSDRHQQGREKGYAGDNKPLPDRPEAYADLVVGDEIEGWGSIRAIRTQFGGLQFDIGNMWINPTQFPLSKVVGRNQRRISTGTALNSSGVPDAPFRTSWPLQLFKRALRDAVADGKDWIGWTTGETQAARYDLSRQVDSISVSRGGGETWEIWADKDGRQLFNNHNVSSIDQVASIIGKDLAVKVSDMKPGELARTFSGLDLKVGGEGMKGFYDTMVPKEVAKYVKQWGGQVEKQRMGKEPSKAFTDAVERFEEAKRKYGATSQQAAEAMMAIPNESGGGGVAEYWRVNITPQMREGIKKAGQALFVGGAAAVVAEDQLEQ